MREATGSVDWIIKYRFYVLAGAFFGEYNSGNPLVNKFRMIRRCIGENH